MRLEWRTGSAGCLTPLFLLGACLFFYWARNPGAVTERDMEMRGGIFVRIAASADWHGIGWGYLAIGLVMAWFAVQFVWRFAERVAVTAGPNGLRMRGMFGGFVPWHDVEHVRFSPGKPAGIEIALKRAQPGLFNPIPRTVHRIVGVETDNGAGFAFAETAERLRTGAGA
ncbi:PH domain-containing protein [Sphingomonas sp. KR3-1]|uniref:PH domain-containing protein n=1 Tax=Sphingomonas sp. KR3-1 TaxID=3156611 RepID=UPI0032B5C7D6